MEPTNPEQQRARDEAERGVYKSAHITESTNGGVGALPPKPDMSVGVVEFGARGVAPVLGSERNGSYGNGRQIRYDNPLEEEPYLVSPEKMLCHAIFRRAIMDLTKEPHIAREARGWIFASPPYNPSLNYVFSCENVCFILDWNHKKTLARVQKYLDGLAKVSPDYQVAGSTAGIPAGGVGRGVATVA